MFTVMVRVWVAKTNPQFLVTADLCHKLAAVKAALVFFSW